MATTSISITPQFGNNTVTKIDCGTSSPRLSGTIDISAFSNLQEFRCNSNDITALSGYENNNNIRVVQFFDNKVTGSIPSLSALTNLTDFRCYTNQLTGSIPSLSGLTNLTFFLCSINQLTGPIPSLSGLTNLQTFTCSLNQLTGPIPSLSGLTNLREFYCHNQLGETKHTGSIPSLSGLTKLLGFYCFNNQLTGFDGGSVSNTLGNFQAQNNRLNQSSIDAILSAFDATTRTTGTKNLFLQAGTNAAPSYTGGVTTVSAGNLFTTLGTVVTAQCTNHGHPDNSLVTITGLQTVFTGTFQISAINADQFRYTVSTNSPTLVTGTGTATMRRTTNATDGFRYYQNLALVSRYGTPSPVLQGFPWSVNINFP